MCLDCVYVSEERTVSFLRVTEIDSGGSFGIHLIEQKKYTTQRHIPIDDDWTATAMWTLNTVCFVLSVQNEFFLFNGDNFNNDNISTITTARFFSSAKWTYLKFKEETSTVLRFESSFVWY